jgi:hypothetical protein
MEKAYNSLKLGFEKDSMILMVDNQTIYLKLKDISEKLLKATAHELNDFKISPSGYGIHWKLLDEDLSVNGLLKLARQKLPGNKLSI